MQVDAALPGLVRRCIFCTFRSQIPPGEYALRRSYGSVTTNKHGEKLQITRNAVVSRRTLRDRLEVDIRNEANFDPVRSKGWSSRSQSSASRPRRMSKHAEKLARSQLSQVQTISMVLDRLERMENQVSDEDFLTKTGLLKDTAHAHFIDFSQHMKRMLASRSMQGNKWKPPRVYESLRQAFIQSGDAGVDSQLRFGLQGHVANLSFTMEDVVSHARLADLRYPYEWYTGARHMQRQIHVHVGPTNSGKTYHALQRLEQAESGIYAGPLRLLAHEVYSRLNAKGKPCDLITGDERILVEEGEAPMCSCTVEMVPTARTLDVAVIDEIQMIGHEERGWAWTHAFLGLRAKEIHLCGEDRALPLISELAAAMGDKLHIHRYERLSPLHTMPTSLEGKFQNLRKGDCLVAFSRREIHAMKAEIERITKKKVAVVYGSLPPEIRAQQARLFNDPDNDYDILVASDAIGMGLNLSIKRIVFEATSRFSMGQIRPLATSDIKQIGGRAGRFRVAPGLAGERQVATETNTASSSEIAPKSSRSTIGLITSLHEWDLPAIHKAMATAADPISSAGVLPPDSLVLRFASYFPPQTPFSYIILRLHEISRMHSRFHLCRPSDAVEIADAIQEVKGLSLSERMVFCAAPASMRDPGVPDIVRAYARCVDKQGGGKLLNIAELDLELLDYDGTKDPNYLYNLELLHKALVLYLWLSYRFNGIFVSQALAFHVKRLLEEKIDQALAGATYKSKSQKQLKKLRELAIRQEFQDQINLSEEDKLEHEQGGEDEHAHEYGHENLKPDLGNHHRFAGKAHDVPEEPINLAIDFLNIEAETSEPVKHL